MNADRLLVHYERIADAPDAIARLRRFILDLAVRGKLVPQDANDEPASELLKWIAVEKARLVRAGEIRKEKPLPEIERDETPFDPPQGMGMGAYPQGHERSWTEGSRSRFHIH
jgi:type I restriction enzyme, S subunit